MLSPPTMVTCDFHTFINDKNSERFFLEFLAGDTNMNIYQSIYDFWVICHKYQSTFGHSSPEKASKLAHRIIRTYVTQEVDRDYQKTCPLSAASSRYIDVNSSGIRGILSEQTLKKLLDALNKNAGLSVNLFEKAQLEVEDYLRIFVYPYFLKSDHFKQYTMAHIHPDENPECNDRTSDPVSGISTHGADSNLSHSPTDELDPQWCGAVNPVSDVHPPRSLKSSTESPSVVIKNIAEGSPNSWEELSAFDWSPDEVNIQTGVGKLSVEEVPKEVQTEQASNKNSETVADGALEEQLEATRSAAFDLHSSFASFSWAQTLFAQTAREELSQPIRAESILDHHLSRVWRKRARCMMAEDRLEGQERRIRERSPEEVLPIHQVGRYPNGYTPHLDLRPSNNLQCKMDLKASGCLPNNYDLEKAQERMDLLTENGIKHVHCCEKSWNPPLRPTSWIQSGHFAAPPVSKRPTTTCQIHCGECHHRQCHHHHHHHHHHYYHYHYHCCQAHFNLSAFDKHLLAHNETKHQQPFYISSLDQQACHPAKALVSELRQDLDLNMKHQSKRSSYSSSSSSSFCLHKGCLHLDGHQRSSNPQYKGYRDMHTNTPQLKHSSSTPNLTQSHTVSNRNDNKNTRSFFKTPPRFLSGQQLCTSQSYQTPQAPTDRKGTMGGFCIVYAIPGEQWPHLTYWEDTQITLGQFKRLVANTNRSPIKTACQSNRCYRYFFKCHSDEFPPGVVYQEYCVDNSHLPQWNGSVWGKVETCELP
ncbi:hypothetical protein CRM22_003134 [Opisthorchis felineus]|uniref:RGS domain-containing protein n=1 Tax=Opisthorchis felineus TaxID=147828 RepID=A0A4S2M7J1_OPIFE|nr:hypothetical protein CRM22_003134 [Opisthorchis felineus]